MEPEETEVTSRILLVEDEDLLRRSVQRFLRKRNYRVESVGDGRRGLRKILSTTYDLLITDLQLEGIGGLRLAAAARESNPFLQVIIITGAGSKESILEALRQGVWDYVEKPFNLEFLLISIEKALEKIRMEKELVRLSRTDGLTGLFNQRHFYSVLDTEMKRAVRQNHCLSLILLDVDNFKDFNSREGHLAGDEILSEIASCIKRACRKDVDLAFRYGGDEFVVILPEADHTTAETVAERITRFLREAGLGLTLSIGVTELTKASDIKAAVRKADEAMYLAKQLGGDRTVTFDNSR